MQIINWENLKNLELGGKKTALTIGVFDGLHRGHRALIAKIIEKSPMFLPTVVTFRENPKKPGNKREKTDDIIGFKEKMTLLEDYGIALSVIIDFSEDFSKMNGRDFLEALNRYLSPAYIGLGEDFHCGYRKDTDAKTFKSLAESLGIEAEIIPPVMEGGLPVSSSRIRSALKQGRSEEAALLMGRPISSQ